MTWATHDYPLSYSLVSHCLPSSWQIIPSSSTSVPAVTQMADGRSLCDAHFPVEDVQALQTTDKDLQGIFASEARAQRNGILFALEVL